MDVLYVGSPCWLYSSVGLRKYLNVLVAYYHIEPLVGAVLFLQSETWHQSGGLTTNIAETLATRANYFKMIHSTAMALALIENEETPFASYKNTTNH
jgi:hypothetical protein